MKRNLATMDTDMFTPIGRLLQQAMAHGITNDMIFGGLEVGQTALQGLYVAQTTKNCAYGTRRVKWDGRVFKYGKCGTYNIATNKYGVGNMSILVANKVNGVKTNEVVMTDAVVGATVITVTFTAGTLGDSQTTTYTEKVGNDVPENDLVGGYISLYTGDYRQQRMIVGNTAVAAGGLTMDITLDEPLDHVLTAGGSYCEIMASPYANVGQTTSTWVSIIAMANVTAVIDQCLWLQTWGPLRISGTTITLGNEQSERQYVFASNGAVIPHDNSNETMELQHAGFLIERTEEADYSAAPFIMLQISV